MTCIQRIVNAAPMVVNRNTRDVSGRVLPVSSVPLPQHLPLWYIQTERGPTHKMIVDPADMKALYGDTSFDDVGTWTNHQTMGLVEAVKEANIVAVQRVSQGTHANLMLWLDIGEAEVRLYERDVHGNIILNSNGRPNDIGSTQGYLARWRISSSTGYLHGATGQAHTKQGSLPGGSLQYPILELAEQYPGAFGNNVGIKMYTPPIGSIDEYKMRQDNAFPIRFGIMERDNGYTTGRLKSTILGEKLIDVSFSPNAKSLVDDRSYKIDDAIRSKYNNTTDTRYRKIYGDYLDVCHLYDDNIKEILDMVFPKERAYVEQEVANLSGIVSNFPLDNLSENLSEGEQYLFNLVGGVDHGGVPYYTFAFDEDAVLTNGIKLTNVATLYNQGGEDQNMNVTEYERVVRYHMDEYNDCNHDVQDLARNPESILYDTGFSLQTKKKLTNFISQRPDTFLVLQTHWDNTNIKGWEIVPDPLPLPPDWVNPVISDHTKEYELSVGSALRTALLLMPESIYFGTPTFRGMIFTNNGTFRNRGWRKRIGFSFYLIHKAARYMGASNGKWRSGGQFSRAPGNIIDRITDVKVPWLPVDTRIRYWDVGLNFPLTYDMERLFMPALQTVSPDDTSVLNSFTNAVAICYLYKISYMAWREFSGTDDLNGEALVRAVNDFVTLKVRGIYDDRYVIQPDAYISVDDELRGYSWTLLIRIYANNMKTVEKLIIESHRYDDLTEEEANNG